MWLDTSHTMFDYTHTFTAYVNIIIYEIGGEGASESTLDPV